MKTELVQSLTTNFEACAQRADNGVEFWLARDLQHLLGYSEWRNFLAVVNKGKTACEVSDHTVADHFVDVNKMVDLGSGNRPLADFAPTIILKAKDFAAEITIFNVRQHQMGTETAVSKEHVTNNAAVRKTLLERGIRPESLPPAEDVKKVERRLVSEDKKALKKPDALDS
jgi:DNA-damage-inducible protein D